MWRTWPRRVALVLSVVIAVVGLLTAPAPGRATVSSLNSQFDKLSTMSAARADRYLKTHPKEQIALLNAQPKAVAAYWAGSSPAEKGDAIRTEPQIIGNLDGVDYASRDKANRIELQRELAAQERMSARNPSNETVRKKLASLRAIDATVGGHHKIPRYLTMLTSDSPPLAAVAIGNLDTAQQVTYNIPGMGTYSDDMQLWTQAAVNVYVAQGWAGATKKRAVVAWIGYVTPPPGIDAILGDYAARGSQLVAEAIQGFWAARKSARAAEKPAVRAKDPLPQVSIIAHSYGTTTSADALADHDLKVFAFVMLGSAGIERSIPNAAALHAERVYAGEAADDAEARWGRITRVDPRSPAFGAIVIGVDGTEGLYGVTGHDPILHSNYNDNPASAAWNWIKNKKQLAQEFAQHLKTYGYFDVGTESLENAAIATTPDATRGIINPTFRR